MNTQNTIKISALKSNIRNPRKISEEALAKLMLSIGRDPQFMVLRPIITDETGVILGGNQRYRACKDLGMKEIPYNWVRVAEGLTEEQRKRFILVDNAPEGMAGAWDHDILKEEWGLVELDDLGFDLSSLLDDKPAVDIVADSVPQLPTPIQRGQLWHLGEHRVLIGDPDSAVDRSKLLGSSEAALSFGEIRDNPIVLEPEGRTKNAADGERPNVVFYSGGKDSLALLIVMKREGIRIDSVVSCHLGSWEWPELDAHHKKVEEYIGVGISWIKIGDVIEEKFRKYGFPQVFARWCNTEKLKSIKNYVQKTWGGAENITQFVGIAYSERERLYKDHYKKGNYRFPLIEKGVTEECALQMCRDEGFDFGGVYEKQHRLSCWCCPLTRDDYIFDFRNDPEKWETLRKMQAVSPTPFKLPYKSIYWFEHAYWERYSRKGESKTAAIFGRRDKPDSKILGVLVEYLEANTKRGDIVFCAEHYLNDCLAACENIGRRCYGVTADIEQAQEVFIAYKKSTGKEPRC